MGAPTQEMLQPAAPEETVPTADTNDVDACVILKAKVITQTSLKPFPRFNFFEVGASIQSNGV